MRKLLEQRSLLRAVLIFSDSDLQLQGASPHPRFGAAYLLRYLSQTKAGQCERPQLGILGRRPKILSHFPLAFSPNVSRRWCTELLPRSWKLNNNASEA